MKETIRRIPLLGTAARRVNFAIRKQIRARTFRGSATEWEAHYLSGGTSGEGSYGALAEFKAEVINDFVARKGIGSVLELGCGDGNQLTLAKYPTYIGLDVSRAAIALCGQRFLDDPTKSFFLYDPAAFFDHAGIFRADLVLSLDVIFHVVENAVFERYMSDLFAIARRNVIIYSSDHDAPGYDAGLRHRQWSLWVERHATDWVITERIPNRYPFKGDARTGSHSDFFILERRVSE